MRDKKVNKWKKFLNVLLIVVVFNAYLFAKTIWNGTNNIYSNKKKYKVGDVLQVIFDEKTLVNYQVSLTEFSKNTALTRKGSGSYINFLPDLGGGNNFQTSQKSVTKNKGKLSKRVMVRIVKILDNNNLQVSGSHTIQINDTYEQVKIEGIVNPSTIKHKKFIYSTDIIEPIIVYKSTIIKNDEITPQDFKLTFKTNIVKTHSDKKKYELIIKYLNKVLSILFKK